MRFAVLAHGSWVPGGAKTGEALVRYATTGWSPHEVVAVVDRDCQDENAARVAGPAAENVPIVADAAAAFALGADAVAVGIAPVGGGLPDDWRPDLVAALSSGRTVVSGLHTRLANDPELAAAARDNGGTIQDVRAPPTKQRVATGAAAVLDTLVVTIVGTDCGSGKMTTAIELTRAARARGIDAGFVATGQTGIMVGCDAGVPLDACVIDFAPGLMEQAVLDAAATGRKVLFVEGQGSLSHPAYAAVSLALLHGSFPDLLVLCDDPTRASLDAFDDGPVQFGVNRVGHEMHLNEALVERVTDARVAALSLMTRGLEGEALRDAFRAAQTDTGVPVGDVFRGGADAILDAVLAAAEKRGVWRDGAPVPGAKQATRSRFAAVRAVRRT